MKYFTVNGLLPSPTHKLLSVSRYLKVMDQRKECDVCCSDGYVAVKKIGDAYHLSTSTGKLNF